MLKRKYNSLDILKLTYGYYSIVPIREEDRYDIMKWRNEQLYHLRQNKLLTVKDQDNYFGNVVSKLFDNSHPEQILFSFIEKEKCVGYGGLVHINWKDQNAEISFIMNTELEKNNFTKYWFIYLGLIEIVAFRELSLHKIYTYAFNLRPALFDILERKGYMNNAILKDHIDINGTYIDVLIHEKLSEHFTLRKADSFDNIITYKWASDLSVRTHSFNNHKISWEEHNIWFSKKLADKACEYFILEHEGSIIGSIRFDVEENKTAVISYLIDPVFQGKGYGKIILKKGVEKLEKIRPEISKVYGYVKKENVASVKIFIRLAYQKILDDGEKLKFEKEI